MANAIQSQGIVFKVSIPGSPTLLAQVQNVTGFNLSAKSPEIDVSNLDSAGAETLIGIPKWAMSIEANLDPDNARHIEMRNAMINRTRIEWSLTLTDASPAVVSGFGYISEWTVRGAVNDKVPLAVAVAIDGNPAWA